MKYVDDANKNKPFAGKVVVLDKTLDKFCSWQKKLN